LSASSKYPLPGHETMVQNIVSAWDKATDYHSHGREWYESAHTYLAGLATVYNTPLANVAGITAVLSPSVSWDINLLETEQVLLDNRDFRYRAYRENVDKAFAVRGGDLSRIRGPKVIAFATLLLHPRAHTVVVDRHALSVALGFKVEGRGYNTLPRIRKFQTAYVDAALHLGEKASHVQAATWLWIREKTE